MTSHNERQVGVTEISWMKNAARCVFQPAVAASF